MVLDSTKLVRKMVKACFVKERHDLDFLHQRDRLPTLIGVLEKDPWGSRLVTKRVCLLPMLIPKGTIAETTGSGMRILVRLGCYSPLMMMNRIRLRRILMVIRAV